LLRAESDLRGLAGVDFERVPGDVSEPEKLKRAMAGCDWCSGANYFRRKRVIWRGIF